MRRLLVILALTVSALGLTAGSASAVPPTLTIGSATPAYVNAFVNGTLDPGDNTTAYNFQYTTDPLVEGWKDGPLWLEQSIPANAGPTPVGEDLHEVPGSCCPTFGVALRPGTTYKYRLQGTNVEGQFFSPVAEFTTLPVAPPTVLNFAGATDIGNYTAEPVATIDRPVGTNFAFDVSLPLRVHHGRCLPTPQ